MLRPARRVKRAVRRSTKNKAIYFEKYYDKSEKEIDELWAKEVEERIEAYDQGKIKAISLEKVLEKYR